MVKGIEYFFMGIFRAFGIDAFDGILYILLGILIIILLLALIAALGFVLLSLYFICDDFVRKIIKKLKRNK